MAKSQQSFNKAEKEKKKAKKKKFLIISMPYILTVGILNEILGNFMVFLSNDFRI